MVITFLGASLIFICCSDLRRCACDRTRRQLDHALDWAAQIRQRNSGPSIVGPLFRSTRPGSRAKLNGVPRDVDEEDIALSALKSVFFDLRADRYRDLSNRTELWPLLVKITLRKCQNALKHQYALKRSPHAEDRQLSVNEVLDSKSASTLLVDLLDELQRLTTSLGDHRLEAIATLRLQGYTVGEIADQLKISERSVARKLRRIRREWQEIAP